MKIGFFGGCFNPITNIHLNIAKNLINQNYVDRIIFVPMGDLYPKEDLAPANDRLKMIQIAIEGETSIGVDDLEIKEKRRLFASDAFDMISKRYSDRREIYFVMGSDNFEKMSKWKEYDNIIKKYNYIVVSRNGGTLKSSEKNIIFIESSGGKQFDSTSVRNKIKEHIDFSMYVPHGVHNYIRNNGLYLNKE